MDQDALNGWKNSQDGLNGDGTGDLCNLNNNNNGSNSADNNNCQIQKALHHQTTSLSALAHYLPKKLQVTEKDGLFIALDNNSLKLMRHLERTGRCSEVEVEIVPLSKVPPNIVQEIFTNHHQQRCGMTSGGTTRSNSTHAYSNHNHQNKHRKQCHNCRRCCSSHHYTSSNHCNRKNGTTGQCCGARANEIHSSGNDIELKPLVDSSHNKAHQKLHSKPEEGYHNHVLVPKDESQQWSSTVITLTTTTSATNSSSSNNTYLSDQQLRSARLSNTMTVMAPCLRQPITTSAPASDLSMRNFKWNNCCNERISANQKMTKLLTFNKYEELDNQEDGNNDDSGNCDENDENQLPHVQIHKPNSQCLLASKLGFNRSKASTANDTTAAVTNHNHGYTKLSANQFDSHTPDGCISSNGSNCCGCLRLMGDSIIRKKHQDSSAQGMHSTNGSACHHAHHHVQHNAQLHCSNQCAKFKCIHQQLKTSSYLNKNNNQDLEGGHCYGNGEQLSCDEDEDDEENNDDNEDNEDEDEDCEDEEDTDDNENDEDEDVSSDEDEDEDNEDNFNSNCHGNHFHSFRSFDNSVCSNDKDDVHQEICDSEGDEEDVDEDDIDSMCELFVCNVCDRTYKTARNMAKHQVRRRHFGCSICDTVFPTLYSLEQHKESLEHWSDDESALDMSFLECTEHSHDRHSHHSYKKCDDIEANGETMIALNTFSNHGYPSVASNHLKNSRNNNSDQQTKLSLKDTTVAGMLAKSNGKGILNGFTGGNINGTLKLQTHKSSHHQHNHNHNFLHKTNENHGNNQAKVSTPTSNNSQKVIFSSSLSSKLMASVFNFYSSTSLSSTGSNGSLVKSANRLDFASNTHQEDMKRLV